MAFLFSKTQKEFIEEKISEIKCLNSSSLIGNWWKLFAFSWRRMWPTSKSPAFSSNKWFCGNDLNHCEIKHGPTSMHPQCHIRVQCGTIALLDCVNPSWETKFTYKVSILYLSALLLETWHDTFSLLSISILSVQVWHVVADQRSIPQGI